MNIQQSTISNHYTQFTITSVLELIWIDWIGDLLSSDILLQSTFYFQPYFKWCYTDSLRQATVKITQYEKKQILQMRNVVTINCCSSLCSRALYDAIMFA